MGNDIGQAASQMTKSYSPGARLVSVVVLHPLLRIFIRNKWEGTENIPKKGAVIFAPNHMSYMDWGRTRCFSRLMVDTRRS